METTHDYPRTHKSHFQTSEAILGRPLVTETFLATQYEGTIPEACEDQHLTPLSLLQPGFR